MQQQGMSWTFQDYDHLYKHYNQEGAEKCSEDLSRSRPSVTSKALKMGLHREGAFRPEEIKLAKSYGKVLHGALIFLLPNRTTSEVEELIECVNQS